MTELTTPQPLRPSHRLRRLVATLLLAASTVTVVGAAAQPAHADAFVVDFTPSNTVRAYNIDGHRLFRIDCKLFTPAYDIVTAGGVFTQFYYGNNATGGRFGNWFYSWGTNQSSAEFVPNFGWIGSGYGRQSSGRNLSLNVQYPGRTKVFVWARTYSGRTGWSNWTYLSLGC